MKKIEMLEKKEKELIFTATKATKPKEKQPTENSLLRIPLPVITQLEEKLAEAEVEAAPVLATIHEYEEAVQTLKHELYDGTHRNAGGVMRTVRKHEMMPEELIAKERELAEKETLLADWQEKLDSPVAYNTLESMNRGRTTAKIEKLRQRIKEVQERAEEHRQKIAALDSSENVARIQAKAEEKRREAKNLAEEADRLETERQEKIAQERVELRRLTGSEL